MIGPEVMLASPNSRANEQLIARLMNEGYLFELKFDGIRAVAFRTQHTVRIFNRRQAEITHRYPEVVQQLADKATFTGWVDGEIIVPGPDGRPDFGAAHLRDAQSNPVRAAALALKHPATFMPFDVLELRGRDVRTQLYTERHARLVDVFPDSAISLSSFDGATMWAFVKANDLEGLVAKAPASQYRAGRQKAWQKVKLTHRVSAIVRDITPGNGSRGAVGALELALWSPESSQLVNIGRVGSGMSDKQLLELEQLFIEPDNMLVVEVEYLEVSDAGQLRMPVFRGVRRDIPATSCTVDTLPGLRSVLRTGRRW